MKNEFIILKIYFEATYIVFYKVFISKTCLGEWVNCLQMELCTYTFFNQRLFS